MSSSKLTSVQIPVSLDGLTYFAKRYSSALEKNPIVVKSLTSGMMATLGNIIGQRLQARNSEKKQTSSPIIITGEEDDDETSKWIIGKLLNWRTVASYLLYGTFINGPISHFYLNLLERYGPKNSLAKLMFDRLIYGPVFLYFTLYLLSLFQGFSHKDTVQKIRKMYWGALKGNLKIWVICQYINFNFVPLQYRTVVACLIALVWNIYLSGRLQKA